MSSPEVTAIVISLMGLIGVGLLHLISLDKKEPKKPTIIRDPLKLKPTTCRKCGCKYQATWSHIESDWDIQSDKLIKISVTRCPFCYEKNTVEVEKEETK